MNVAIFDTTLRDGEQSPGATMSANDRLAIARALDAAGTDVIEAGFPAASPATFDSVKAIAATVRNASVAALCRLNAEDIDRAWDAVRAARRPRLFSFIATSDAHIAVKLRSTRADVIAAIDTHVRTMASRTEAVAFGAEDATRSDRDFLVRAFNVAALAGASVVVLPDTVGCMVPAEFGRLVAYVRERLPDHVALSVHCHDDLGLAVANTLEAVRNGATEVQVTVNGIGERAGNCSLEEVVVALRLRADYYGATIHFRTEHVARLSALVAAATDIAVANNKAIVGRNAFVHESGIHQAGVVRDRTLYEFIPAEFVGRAGGQLSFGRNSGRTGLRSRCEQLGIALTTEQLDRAYAVFLGIANGTRSVDDGQIRRIAGAVAPVAFEAAG